VVDRKRNWRNRREIVRTPIVVKIVLQVLSSKPRGKAMAAKGRRSVAAIVEKESMVEFRLLRV
jgi:hypothetical protein